jgi:hypothetical protein
VDCPGRVTDHLGCETVGKLGERVALAHWLVLKRWMTSSVISTASSA